MALERFFATTPRGLEAILTDELTAQGATDCRTVAGGVQFRADWACCYKANLESRVATRILWQVADGFYRDEDDIYKIAAKQPWPSLFALDKTFRVVSTAVRCPLKSLDFVTLRIKDAVCDRFRDLYDKRPNIDTRDPDVRVHVFLTEDHCTLYLDTSGAPLWQRGLRHANVEAPLKENIAAGILKLSGWVPGKPLLDPMCGSGTFILEAACMSLDMAPGLHRVKFGFESLSCFDAKAWGSIRQDALNRQQDPHTLPLFASDIDPRAVRATRRNLQEAGLGNVAKVEEADVLELFAPESEGILVANPPYGERIGEIDALTRLYPAIGDTLKKRFAGWNGYFFTADLRLAKLIGLRPSRKIPLFNGSLECRLFEIRVVAGSNRKEKPVDSPLHENHEQA
jgi:putative N6-adenine-specific DNA methylase